jgi:hypothetical protein
VSTLALYSDHILGHPCMMSSQGLYALAAIYIPSTETHNNGVEWRVSPGERLAVLC